MSLLGRQRTFIATDFSAANLLDLAPRTLRRWNSLDRQTRCTTRTGLVLLLTGRSSPGQSGACAPDPAFLPAARKAG
jgi:hypothetical protein